MPMLIPVALRCPYCGESIELLVDGSAPDQQYVEDCPVCCRPIEVAALVDAQGAAHVDVRTDGGG